MLFDLLLKNDKNIDFFNLLSLIEGFKTIVIKFY